MATQRSGTFFGFIIGLFTGLALAAVVAFFMLRSSPFSKKEEAKESSPAPVATQQAPAASDPNQALYGNQNNQQQANGQQSEADFRANAPAATNTNSPYPKAPDTAPTIQKPAPPAEAANAGGTQQVYLQAGAFKSLDQANNQKGSIAFLGIKAQVQKSADDFYRVRIGPVSSSTAVSLQSKLKSNGITTTVIR